MQKWEPNVEIEPLVLGANPIDGRIWLFPPKAEGQSSSDEPFTA
jgi:hypothetical protein